MSTTWRRPTGRPGWPKILLAGTEKSGKSMEIARLSASPMIGRTFWISFGERSPDEYGEVPGADFDLVEPADRFELEAVVREAVAAPRADPDLPNLIALDSSSPYWELLGLEGQAKANKRAADKAAKGARNYDPREDSDISTDLWNEARDNWYRVMRPLLTYPDLVVITGRLDLVMVMENGRPARNGAKEWKVAAQKRLGSDVDAILQFRGPWGDQERATTGIRSLAYAGKAVQGNWKKPDDYGVIELLADMNVSPETVGGGPATISIPDREGVVPGLIEDELLVHIANDDLDAIRAMYKPAPNDAARAAIMAAGEQVKANLAALREQDEAPPAEEAPRASDAVMHENVRQAVQSDVVEGTSEPAPEPPADDPGPEPEPEEEQRIIQLTPEQRRAMAQCRARIDGEVSDSMRNDRALNVKKIQAAVRQAKSQGWVEVEQHGLAILRENAETP